MQCPECSTENPSQAKFCLNCGTKLAVICPECGASLPAQAKFCFECGTKLGAPPTPAPEPSEPPAPPEPPTVPAPGTPESMAERLQRLVPKEFAERLMAARGKVGSERRIVTILFSDVKGSTAMAEELDPEDVMEIMEGAFDVLIEPIYRHEGTLARLMGDAILAFFGAPIAHEDDPARACRAALDIIEGAKGYAERLQGERGISGFNVRVGINTGLVVVGEIGSDLRAEYTAMGDAVNLAARMEQAAPVGGVLISHNTYRYLEGTFDTQALEPIEVKGKKEPVQVYLVERARPRTFSLRTCGVEGVETRMIGREAELEHLQDALVTVAEDAGLRMVTITGEVGIGKSRLLSEFDSWLEGSPQTIHTFKGQANQQTQRTPYTLLRDLLSFQFQIQENDPASIARDKLERGICSLLSSDDEEASLEAQMRAHFIGQLLGFDYGDSPHLQGILEDAQQIRDRALMYLGEFFQASAREAPTAIFLDDVHWADGSSLDVIDHLAQTMQGQRLLIVCLARPRLFERRPHWGEDQGFHTHLELDPLSEQNSRRLVDEILQKVADLPATLRRLIVDSAEGNPLYVEELIKMLIEDGVIVKGEDEQTPWRVEPERLADIRVPPTLVGVLQARLDSLPHQNRTILQRASVVGRTFWDSAVERISQSADDGQGQEGIRSVLSELGKREIVFAQDVSAFAGTEEYLFKHGIMREVTYENILRRVRRGYHKLIADWLIEQSGDRAGEFAGLIAEHLESAREIARAIPYLRQAGEQAAAKYANVAAVDYFSRALKLIEKVDWEPARVHEEQYGLLLGREGVYGLMGEREAQAGDLTVLKTLAEEMGQDRQRAQVARRQALYHEATSDFPAALAAAREAIGWAEQAADIRQKTEALIDSGIALWQQGLFDEARAPLEEALTLAREQDNQAAMASGLHNLGVLRYFQGDLQEAAAHWEQVLEIRRGLGDLRGEATCLRNLVAVYHGLGDLGKARTSSQQAVALYQTIGDRRGEAGALTNLAIIHHTLGDLQAARGVNEQAIALCQAIGDRQGEALASHNLGLVLYDLGDAETARQYCRQALDINVAIEDQTSEGYSLTYLGLALEGLDELDAAAANYTEALALRRDIGQAALAMDDLAGLARVALKQGEQAQALAHTEEMLAWIEEHGVEGIEYPLRVYLTAVDVLIATGQKEQASGLLASAQALLEEQAACISDEATRHAFLDSVPLHREVRERASLL